MAIRSDASVEPLSGTEVLIEPTVGTGQRSLAHTDAEVRGIYGRRQRQRYALRQQQLNQ